MRKIHQEPKYHQKQLSLQLIQMKTHVKREHLVVNLSLSLEKK